MPTLNLQVSASSDDANQRSNGNNYADSIISLTIGGSSPYRWGGLRFELSSAIPSGATIDSAYLSFPTMTAVDDIRVDVHAHDTDDAATFSNSSGSDVVSRTLTTAFVDWSEDNVASDQQSPDLSSVIQELVDSYGGLASGAGLVLILEHTGTGETFRPRTYDNDPGDGAELEITYTAASGGGNNLINGGLVNGGLVNGGLVA